MDKFVIHGGHRLTGEIEVSGAKNAAVALIPAVLLSDEPCVLENVPDISDVSISLQIMSEMGATVEYLTKTTVRISAAGLTNYCVPYESARKMRASYYFLGALLGRYGKARVSMPGGCPLGDRPIDQHLKAFAALGAKCNIEHGMVDLVADRIVQDDCKNGFVLDGFPRTIPQAEALVAQDVRIDKVVSIEIADQVIEDRMVGRRVCSSCGASYHITANPPKVEGVCDSCGGEARVPFQPREGRPIYCSACYAKMKEEA